MFATLSLHYSFSCQQYKDPVTQARCLAWKKASEKAEIITTSDNVMNYQPSSLNVLFSYLFIAVIVVIVAVSNAGNDDVADGPADGAGNDLGTYVSDIDAEARLYADEELLMDESTNSEPTADGPGTTQAAQSTELWFINLTSLDSQEKANSYVEKARAKGIDATQKKVTVNGRQFWRVYVSGFSSHDAASSAGTSIKSRLKLKDVWIARES